jgi:hypothetical protein
VQPPNPRADEHDAGNYSPHEALGGHDAGLEVSALLRPAFASKARGLRVAAAGLFFSEQCLRSAFGLQIFEGAKGKHACMLHHLLYDCLSLHVLDEGHIVTCMLLSEETKVMFFYYATLALIPFGGFGNDVLCVVVNENRNSLLGL